MNSFSINFTQVDEADGSLVYMESMSEIPFDVKRVFYIFNTPADAIRAEHANKNTDFVLIAVHGSVKVQVDDGEVKEIYVLDSADKGVFIPRMTWMRTYDFSDDAVLLVLASEKYERNQYVESYEEFLERKRK